MSIIVDMHDDNTNLGQDDQMMEHGVPITDVNDHNRINLGQDDQMMEHGVPITDVNDHNRINKVILVK